MMEETPTKTWRLSAFDTWFFRESRPMDSIGGSELASVFPPPATTLAGALRTAVAEHAGLTDWSRYAEDPAYADLRERLGDEKGMGKLRLSGPWIVREGTGGSQRLYPLPLNIVARYHEGAVSSLHRLHIGPPQRCDAGAAIRMPQSPAGIEGVKALAGHWVTAKTLSRILAGGTPGPGELIAERDLISHEPRLGIARDNRTRTVEKGLLYQTNQVRPVPGLGVEIDVGGLPPALHPASGAVRLGGEGRAAHFEVLETDTDAPPAPKIQGNPHGLILVLLTPLAVPEGASAMPLPGFKRQDDADGTRWTGSIGKVALTIHSAILGRCLRQGGWDLAGGKPRRVRSLIPPGSLFNATLERGGLDEAIDEIARTRIGNQEDIALGRGQLVAGLWPRNEIHQGTHSKETSS